MGLDVTVIVATFGDRKWERLARDRAATSARSLANKVCLWHGDTLHEARNHALTWIDSEWVCFLDADDELEAGYFDVVPEADVIIPAARYIRGKSGEEARIPNVAGHSHACEPDCLADGNYIVVGAIARADLVRKVGGFHDYEYAEDWDLWVRIWQAGGTFQRHPQSVYRAHRRNGSRNRPSRARIIAGHNAIARANGLPEVE